MWRSGRPGRRCWSALTYYSFDPVLEKHFGPMPEQYWEDLSRRLPPDVGVFWTGSQVCSDAVTAGDIRRIARHLRRPLVLWDNYPVNDGAKRSRFLYCQSPEQRDPALAGELAGHLCNPMNQGLLSLPALAGLASLYGTRPAADAWLSEVLGRVTWEHLQRDRAEFRDAGLDGMGAARCAQGWRSATTACPAPPPGKWRVGCAANILSTLPALRTKAPRMRHSITETDSLSYRRGDPRECFRLWRPDARPGGLLVVDFSLPQYWLPGEPEIALSAIYCLDGDAVRVSVSDQALTTDGSAGVAQYQAWVEQTGAAAVTPGSPLGLCPVQVAKPWGQEIWYSGVEERGLCRFAAGGGESPIPWLQAVLPEATAGDPGEALVLLKVLDPSPEEVTGDLYFELHQEKREVYVVTHIDPEAWPDGVGFIRYGFDPDTLADFHEEAAFRSAYLEAVQAYESVRRELDGGAAATEALNAREAQLRQAMNAFTHLRPLAVGDVVVVPLLLPHSLQHGVRTIEFQTPVYERQILSFAQKVLTQDHWDTREAVARMHLRPPEGDGIVLLEAAGGRRVERIVDFSDFEVCRIGLEPGVVHPHACDQDYAMVMVVSGELLAGEVGCGAEQALLLPRGWSGELASADPARPLVFLLATPRR